MKHDHWDVKECSYCSQQTAPVDAKLHEEYTQLQSAVDDLLRSLDAQKTLDDGFRGMGHNILVERAARINSNIRKLKKIVEWDKE